MDDYAPVATLEDEEEQRRRQAAAFPPVARAFDVGATSGIKAPAPSSDIAVPPAGRIAARETMPAIPDEAPAVARPRPQWSEYAPPESHGWGKFGHAMAAFNPATNLVFNQLPQQRAEEAYKHATAEYEAPINEEHTKAQTALEQAQTGEAQARTEALKNPQEKVGQTPQELTLHYLLTGDQGKPITNPDTGKPYNTVEAYQKVQQIGQDVKPEKERKTEKTVRIIGGVPHEVLVDATTGEDIKDLGQTKVPGESQADKRSAAEQVQVEREARAAVHKAEQDYNGARSTVAMQRQLIKDAKGGNKEAVRIVPLEGALQITTSQGVHRINRTEVEQYGAAGSLYDRIVGKIGSGVSGKSIPDDVLNDMDAMTQELEKNAHDRYRREYDYNKQVVEGYGGKDFDKRVPMVPAEGGAERRTYLGEDYEKQEDGTWKKVTKAKK